MRRRLATGGGVGWALAILLAVCSLALPVQAGQPLPSTPLSLVEGGSLDLKSLKGQVVVIRFLASW